VLVQLDQNGDLLVEQEVVVGPARLEGYTVTECE